MVTLLLPWASSRLDNPFNEEAILKTSLRPFLFVVSLVPWENRLTPGPPQPPFKKGATRCKWANNTYSIGETTTLLLHKVLLRKDMRVVGGAQRTFWKRFKDGEEKIKQDFKCQCIILNRKEFEKCLDSCLQIPTMEWALRASSSPSSRTKPKYSQSWVYTVISQL